jgi:hypothetical protein
VIICHGAKQNLKWDADQGEKGGFINQSKELEGYETKAFVFA